MSLEHAPPGRRAFFTSWTLSGTQAGSILATAVFLPVAALPSDALLSWGWRVPFWLSAIVVAVAFVIRRTIDETPVFTEEVEQGAKAELPLAVLFRDHWSAVLRVVLAATVASVSTIFGVFALSFAVDTAKLDRSAILWVAILANVVALAGHPAAGRAGRPDRAQTAVHHRRAGSAVLTAAYLWSLTTGSYRADLVVGVLLSGVVYSAANGVWPRSTGRCSRPRCGSRAPRWAPRSGSPSAGSPRPWPPRWPADSCRAGCRWRCSPRRCAWVSALAAATARETYRTPMAELGRTPVGHAGRPRGVTALGEASD